MIRSPRYRSTRTVIVGLVALLIVGLATPAQAMEANRNEQIVRSHHNEERISRGIARLSLEEDLILMARRHSRAMYRAGHLYHNPNLVTELLDTLTGILVGSIGENVAVGWSAKWTHDAFMDSAPHRHNILNPKYDHVAVGAIERGDWVWVTVIFVDEGLLGGLL